jgi:hypothetical protein
MINADDLHVTARSSVCGAPQWRSSHFNAMLVSLAVGVITLLLVHLRLVNDHILGGWIDVYKELIGGNMTQCDTCRITLTINAVSIRLHDGVRVHVI